MNKTQINITTRCDEQLTNILRVIAVSVQRMQPQELLKFMHMIVPPPTTKPSHPCEVTADQLYALCAIAGYAVAQTTADAIREKETELKQNN